MSVIDLPGILVFADDWGRHPSSCQHLIRNLLVRRKVHWINTIGTRTPRIDLATLRRGRTCAQPRGRPGATPAHGGLGHERARAKFAESQMHAAYQSLYEDMRRSRITPCNRSDLQAMSPLLFSNTEPVTKERQVTRESEPTLKRLAVLYLVHRMPYPLDKGERIRSFHLIKYLARWCDLSVASLADEPISSEGLRVLRDLCQNVQAVRLPGVWRWVRALGSMALGRTASEGAFHSAGLRRVLRSWVREQGFDAVVVSASSLVPYLCMTELRSIPAVVDLVDIDSHKWLKFAARSSWPRSWVYQTEGRRLQRLEGRLPGWTRGVTLVSEAEVELLRQYCVPGTVEVARQGVDLEYYTPQTQDVEPSCVFTGTLNYRPNVEGICWFCRAVWPTLHRRRPEAKLYLVGQKPSPAVRRLAAIPGVQLVGSVPDVRPYLARSAVAIVPLLIAQGVQNKALEAMAMGKATVVSTQVLGGLRAEPGKHVLAASTTEEWLEHIMSLFDRTELRQRLGNAGRQFVEHRHPWDRCLAPIGKLLGLPEPAWK